MPVTLLGIYYNMSDAVKVYHHENGEVHVTGGDEFYAVHIIKQTSPSSEEYKSRGRLDALSAGEFFDVACRYVNGEIEWTEPVRKFSCTYNPKRSQGCTCENCPRALGGAAYHELFAKSCLYRRNKSR